MIIIAIDPGVHGAVARLDQHGKSAVEDLPTVTSAIGTRLQARELLLLLREWAPVNDAWTLVIEDVRGRPMGNANAHGNTLHSQTSMMRGRGGLEAVADIARKEPVWVTPQKWRKHFGLNGKEVDSDGKLLGKESSRLLAIKLFQDVESRLRRKKDNNRAEALLMARWGMVTLN